MLCGISTSVVRILPKDERPVRLRYPVPRINIFMSESFFSDRDPDFSQMFEKNVWWEEELTKLPSEIRASEVTSLRLFADTFGANPASIYYPCSGSDASLTAAFPDSRIQYVDILELSINRLKNAQLEAYRESVFDYDPGPIDMLLVISPEMDFENGQSYPVWQTAQHLNDGGYVLVNNRYGTAKQFAELPDFKWCGILKDFTQEEPTLEMAAGDLKLDKWVDDTDPRQYDLFIFQKYRDS